MIEQEKIRIIKEAIEVVEKGGVILYPTDTIWGIGCDATNKKAIEKVYSIKKRSQEKPLIILVDNADLLLNYVKDIPPIANKIIEMESSPVTIIYNNPINLPTILTQNNTIGVRIVKNKQLNIFLNSLGKPLTSTSANIANDKNPLLFSEIKNEIKEKVDYIFPENFIKKNTTNKASKIIKIINNSTTEIIRG